MECFADSVRHGGVSGMTEKTNVMLMAINICVCGGNTSQIPIAIEMTPGESVHF
jgi:hypothetical protein